MATPTHTLNTDYEIVACPPAAPTFWLVRNRHSKSIVVWNEGENPDWSYINQMVNVGKPRKFVTRQLAQEYIDNA